MKDFMAKLRRAREHYFAWRDPVPTRRYKIDQSDYSGFPSSEDRDEFIKRQLEIRGFDISKPVEQYRGVTNSYILFEQLPSEGGESL